jgi:hypothetical protein
LQGSREQARFDVPSFFGASMNTRDKAKLIAEYVQLRDTLSALYREVTVVDQQLMDLEHRLPEEYVYPGDLPESWICKRKRTSK